MFTIKGILLITATLSLYAQETKAAFSPNVTVRRCSSQRVVIRLENASDGGLIYIQDRGSACKRTTFSQQKNYEFDFDLCNIEYDVKFRVVVQKDPYYQTGYDKVIPVMCLLDTEDLQVSNIIYPEDVLDPSVNKTIRPTVRMRMLTESDDVTGGEITLNDNVKMSLTLDNPYIEDFDIKATDCTASMIPIVRGECSMDEELFPNFEHKSQGDISTSFRAFQPINPHGEPEVDVAFTCNVAVCKGQCHQAQCGEAVGWGRRKRESDIDDIIENVTCGTTLKVKMPLIQTQEQNGELVAQCVDKYIVTALATVTVVTLFISWIMCGHIYCKLKKLGKEKPQEIRRKSLTERSIDVARAVGRRLSTMFQLPTGYNFGKSPQMDDVAECEETPPTKRRESVHATRLEFIDD